MPNSDGFVWCYDHLYKLLLCTGVITFKLQNQSNGGPQSTRLRVLYAMCARLCLIMGFIGGVYFKLSDPEMSHAMFSHLTPLIKIIFSWEFLSCLITYTQYCLAQDGKRQDHILLLAGMQRLDSEISAQFPHVHWRYHRSRAKFWYGSIAVTSCYVACSMALMFDMAQCSCGYMSTILIAFTYSIITSTLGLMGFIYIAMMDYLRIRFRLIMQLVNQIYMKADRGKFTNGTYEELEERMLRLFDFTKRSSQLLCDSNQVCSYVVAAGLFYDFTHMTTFVYVLCQKLLYFEKWDSQYIFITLHLTIHAYKVLMVSIYGHLLYREKRNCLRLVSNYADHFGNKTTAKQEVEAFQLWRRHNNHGATISQNLSCNISLIYVIFNGLANYVIILVQLLFQLQEKDNKQGYPIVIPNDVELIQPIDQITHLNRVLQINLI